MTSAHPMLGHPFADMDADSLPPDPDGRNHERADWAWTAVALFQRWSGSDDCDALADLLCNVMHLCDRMPDTFGTFAEALARAQGMYADETKASQNKDTPMPHYSYVEIHAEAQALLGTIETENGDWVAYGNDGRLTVDETSLSEDTRRENAGSGWRARFKDSPHGGDYGWNALAGTREQAIINLLAEHVVALRDEIEEAE